MSIASEGTAITAAGSGTIGLRRLFTSPGVHPYDEVVWERRDARISHWQTGAVAFEQLDVEFPATWSQNATNIVAQKYFRGTQGTPERESSLRQVVDRIVDTITQWGLDGSYFATESEADAFSAELKYILITQRAAFNSPVWFNIGVAGVPAQASACFILSVDDEMTSILNWYREEGIIFKGGSGTGVNLSDIRSSKEPMTGGGTASGPVSFMRGADASAGTIKSGGKTRRAAKMVILDADHPDIEEFIWCKAIEERKARALRDAGFDMDLDGADSFSVQYQNANNSVRVTDEFMQAVVDDADWDLVAVTTGEVLETLPARDLWRQIAEAAWECADPGLQFDTTINRWHTAPNTSRITASNPCFTGDSLVHTDKGLIRFDELFAKANIGEEFQVWTHDITNVDAPSEEMHLTTPEAYMITGRNPIQRLRFSNGAELRCTPGHAIFTANRGWVTANELTENDDVRTIDTTIRLVDRIDEGVELTYNLSEPRNHSYVVNGVVVRNCSEYFHLDNSACNLASINLLKYLGDDGTFDVGAFTHTVDVVFTAQEILVGRADYPTEQIAETTRAFRQLGLGYANVGALLMALGLPYDSDEGRAWAAEITSLMTGTAYGASARIASRVGPFEGYADNEEPMLRVLEMHRDASRSIAAADGVPADLVAASRQAWDTAIEAAHRYGVRNSQAVVIAPTGCLVGGSLVATSAGLVRLRGLGNPDGPQWQPLATTVTTPDGERDAVSFYVNGLEQVVHITTERGYHLAGTPTHRIKVVDQAGSWQWRRFGELRRGDRVPLSRHQLIGDSREVQLPMLSEKMAWAGEWHLSVPSLVDVDLAELVGYFMGDGSLHSKGLRFCVANSDPDVVGHLERLGKGLFNLQAAIRPQEGYIEVAFHSTRLVEWWEASGFAKRRPHSGHTGKGYSAHIPDSILATNDPNVYRAFLRGLFEADGTATGGYPSWTTTTLDFSRDVQVVMLALGFVTTRRMCTSGMGSTLFVLRLLNRESNIRWAEEIGFLSDRKSQMIHLEQVVQSARFDHIPITRAIIDRVAPENGRNRRAALMEFRRHGAVSHRLAHDLLDVCEDAELRGLTEFYFDRIAEVDRAEEEFTFDLSVPDGLTYVANGFVSHNTIALAMDCDTTGIEPDLSLVKTKKLVGGGTMSIVNQTIPRALRRLGYSPDEVDDIVTYVDEHLSIVGAPHLAPEHLPVFACSMGDNTIHHTGHVRMMAAVQPAVSGGISKTINVPEQVTVDEIADLHRLSWELGLKSVAIYRDNSKVGQPLSTSKPPVTDVTEAVEVGPDGIVERIIERVVHQPVRQKLPRTRRGKTFEFRVADCKGFATIGEYDNGQPGEIFLTVSKQGSTMAGVMDAFAKSVSYGLQYGVPLRAFVEAFTNMRFEPAGMTDDPDLRFVSSIMDYLFRRLALEYMTYDERAELGIFSVNERLQPTLPGVEEAITQTSQGSDLPPDPKSVPSAGELSTQMQLGLIVETPEDNTAARGIVRPNDAPMCMQCGVVMMRAGSCFACPSCGNTSGCS